MMNKNDIFRHPVFHGKITFASSNASKMSKKIVFQNLKIQFFRVLQPYTMQLSFQQKPWPIY